MGEGDVGTCIGRIYELGKGKGMARGSGRNSWGGGGKGRMDDKTGRDEEGKGG